MKKTVYIWCINETINAIHAIDICGLVRKADYGTKIKNIEERNLLIMINILLILNLISFLSQYLMTD